MLNTINYLLDEGVNKTKNKQYNLVSLSILRIIVGLHVLFELITAFSIKEILWNSSIFNTSITFLHNEFYFYIFYFVGIALMFIYTIGISSIFLNIAVYIFVYILYQASPFLLDGGNNILIIVLFYMIFTNNTQHYSIYSKYKVSNIKNITHNLFLILILVQTCILYFFAGFFKAQGEMWLHGTALYYILSLDSFSMEPFAWLQSIILNSSFLLTLGAYTAIFTQLFFPFLVFNKYTRYILLLGSIGFHLSIIFFMGLTTFGMIMIALDLQFISDDEYNKIVSIFKKWFNNVKLSVKKKINLKDHEKPLKEKIY